MSELTAFDLGPYRAPLDAEDYGERQADGKKFLLYLGEKAIVDVVELHFDENGKELLGGQILRLVDALEKGPAMLNHTSLHVPEDVAREVFGHVAA